MSEYMVQVPVPDAVQERMVLAALKQKHPRWEWDATDDQAARHLWPSAPPEALEALRETRNDIRSNMRMEIANFCHRLLNAVKQIEEEKEDQ